MKAFEFSYPQVEIYDEGEYVEIMQHMLYVRGATLPKYGCDGEYGKETEAAVKKVQTRAGLPADGVVDINTWAYLLCGEVSGIYEDNDIGEDPAAQTRI